MSVFGVMTDNMTSPEYQALEREWGPRLAAAFDEIILNQALFNRVKAIYEARESSGLNVQQQRVVTRLYDQFVQRGANLNPEQKQQLSAYNQELAGLFAEFGEKLLADEQTFITATEADLAGVPADVRAAAAAAARERNLPAGQFAIVNTRSAVDPVLTFADNRGLRERVWRAFVNRGDNANANDTNRIIARIVKVRADRARLLGFPSHAHWRMQDTMAGNPDRAQELMMRVWPAAVARVREEVTDQQAMARRLGHDITIEPWDYRYYMEKVRQDRYDLSQDEIKPYFQLDNMIEGMFFMAGQLYGLRFQENTGQVPVWHPDIRTWRVTNAAGEDVGIFYGDMFARTGKRSGAWMTSYRSRAGLLGDNVVLSSNNNNFTKPGPNEPVLISLDDAETLFHEFGHAIHSFLSDVHYPSLVGTPRDFVEYPSQVHENWVLTPEVLNRFARHYQTNQPMPQALVQRIEAARTFNQGFATVEYLAPPWSTWRCTPTRTASSIPTRSSARRCSGSACRARSSCATGCPSSATSSRPTLIRPAIIPTSGRRRWTPTPGPRSRRPATSGIRRRRSASPQYCCRPATKPTGPKPIASSAAATPTSTRCSGSAASRPASPPSSRPAQENAAAAE